MVRKAVNDLPNVPENEVEWFRQRAEARGIGNDYKKYL
jgi:hypothetical protein